MDNEHMQARWMSGGLPHDAGMSQKELHQRDMRVKDRVGSPTRHPAEEQVGGSRPGVESRVKDAIARREDRETDEA